MPGTGAGSAICGAWPRLACRDAAGAETARKESSSRADTLEADAHPRRLCFFKGIVVVVV